MAKGHLRKVLIILGCASVLSFSPAQTFSNDSLIIREILDLNFLSNLLVEHVADSGGGRITALYLVGLDLDTLIFPSNVGNLDALTLLDVSINNLTTLPPEIGNLIFLEGLYVLYNSLADLPPEIGNLTVLKTLSAANNRLTCLPPEIGGCRGLTDLVLYDNMLTNLPAEFFLLTDLEYLALGNNRFSILSPEIVNLRNLTFLCVLNNELHDLPESITNLTLTSGLEITGNHLTDLSEDLTAWVDLYNLKSDWRETQTGIKNMERNQTERLFCVLHTTIGPVIRFDPPAACRHIEIEAYDMAGNNLMKRVRDIVESGTYYVSLDGKRLASGAYFIRIKVGDCISTQRCCLVK